MVMAKKRRSSRWWWFESHNDTNYTQRSPWLQSTLAELDKKTQAMLKLIEEDADSFAKRAEMYYKKRPELINMVEDFYRTHRLLAERYDQMKSESMSRLLTSWASPLSFAKYQPEKSISSSDKSCDSYSDTYELEDSDESEVDDPEEEVEVQKEMVKEEESSAFVSNEVAKLMDEIEKLKEENRIQKEQLMQKDEEKREVIRHLSVAVDLLREENDKLRKRANKEFPKEQNKTEFNKLKEGFWRKLFNGSPRSQATIIAL